MKALIFYVTLIVLMSTMIVSSACCRVVLADSTGFSLTTVGWVDDARIRDWTGIKIKLEIPPGGYVVLQDIGSIEFYIPCKGRWVEDIGIVISDGCKLDPSTGRDTKSYRLLVVTEEFKCKKYDRVLIMARIPKIFPDKSCIPTAARWVGGYTDVER